MSQPIYSRQILDSRQGVPQGQSGPFAVELKNMYASVPYFQFTISCLPKSYRNKTEYETYGTVSFTTPNKFNRIPEEIKSKLNSGNAYYHSVRELLFFSVLTKNVNNINL